MNKELCIKESLLSNWCNIRNEFRSNVLYPLSCSVYRAYHAVWNLKDTENYKIPLPQRKNYGKDLETSGHTFFLLDAEFISDVMSQDVATDQIQI